MWIGSGTVGACDTRGSQGGSMYMVVECSSREVGGVGGQSPGTSGMNHKDDWVDEGSTVGTVGNRER